MERSVFKVRINSSTTSYFSLARQCAKLKSARAADHDSPGMGPRRHALLSKCDIRVEKLQDVPCRATTFLPSRGEKSQNRSGLGRDHVLAAVPISAALEVDGGNARRRPSRLGIPWRPLHWAAQSVTMCGPSWHSQASRQEAPGRHDDST